MRYVLSVLLFPFAVISLALLAIAYHFAKSVYWLACKADGRKDLPTFDEWINWLRP